MTLSSGFARFKSPYDGQALRHSEIRLLTITWTTSDEFELRTECHALTDGLEFDALSYVWGTTPASIPVKCNNSVLLISPTLFEILGYLCLFKPEPKRPIWIDAICINQADADEKAVQVPQMRQVYSSANTVIVWMRSPTTATSVILKELNRIPEPWNLEPAISEIKELWPSVNDPFWIGLGQLLFSDWLKRLWTFQETVLAKRAVLLCGSVCIDLHQFLKFAVLRYEDDEHFFGKQMFRDSRVLDECQVVLDYHHQIGKGAVEVPFLLQYLRRRHAGEEVDRIWALYGVFDEELQNALAPLIDYSEVARKQYWLTIINCMKLIIQMSQRLDCLWLPPARYPKPPYLPSWCPDIGGREGVALVVYYSWNINRIKASSELADVLNEEASMATRSRYKAVLQHVKRHIVISPAHDHLSVRGFTVDTITEVAEDTQLFGMWDYSTDYENGCQTFCDKNPAHVRATKWLSKSLDLARRTYREDGKDASKFLWEFLMAFWTDHRINNGAKSAFERVWKALSTDDYKSFYSLPDDEYNPTLATFTQYKEIIGHSFFSTEDGRFGLATPGCKPGDKVCVFYGGHPLHIIRPHFNKNHPAREETERLWKFVSTAYIPHLMDQHTNDDARQGPDQIYTLA